MMAALLNCEKNLTTLDLDAVKIQKSLLKLQKKREDFEKRRSILAGKIANLQNVCK